MVVESVSNPLQGVLVLISFPLIVLPQCQRAIGSSLLDSFEGAIGSNAMLLWHS